MPSAARMSETPASIPARPSRRATAEAASREAGFTLVEIMVVIVILGLLATLVARNVIGASDEARINKAQMDVKTIAGGVESYRAKTGRLPETLDELVVDEDGKGELMELPEDPWGNAYELIPGDTPRSWEVISYGPDGNQGGDDDISNRKRDDDR